MRSWTDAEGAWNQRVRNDPEVGAEVMAAVDGVRDRLFSEARVEGRHDSSEAYAADALAELARGNGAAKVRPRAQIIVRVDLPALLRARPAGEVCEVAGFGPVAASAIRNMVDTGDAFSPQWSPSGQQVVGVAHLRRRPTAHQQTALEWLYLRGRRMRLARLAGERTASTGLAAM